MSFSSVGTLGSATSKAASQTVAMTTTATVEIGNLITVIVAWDNNNGTTQTGPLDCQLRCEDSAGNIYVCLASAQNTGSPGAASGGTHAAIFATVARTQLPSGGTITVGSSVNSTLVAKAISAWEFTLGTSHFCLQQNAEHGDHGVDPGAISLSSMPSRQYLFLHCLAVEWDNSDTYTWDADYAQFTPAGTSGGAGGTNQHVRGGFRIATLTGDTVDVTSTTADRDYMQVYAAIYEYTPATFPGPDIVLLDDFNRANEDPLSAAAGWDETTYTVSLGTQNAEVISLQAGQNDIAGDAGSAWGEVFAFNEVDVCATLRTAPVSHAPPWDHLTIFSHFKETAYGNWLGWWRTPLTDILLVAAPVNFAVNPLASDPQRVLLMYACIEMVAGAKWGLGRRESILEIWHDPGSGWSCLGSVFDDSYVSGGIGIIARGITGRLDDFCGPSGPPVTMGQIIRYV
jgi:hypothetical protein